MSYENILPLIGKQFPQEVVTLINAAKESVKIIVFDWRWYPLNPASPVQLFNQAIARAVKRNVKVSAIVNNAEIAATLQNVGVNARKFNLSHLLHVKLMIIDERIVILGSHNYTQNAFSLNHEMSVVMFSPESIHDFVQYFDHLFLSNK